MFSMTSVWILAALTVVSLLSLGAATFIWLKSRSYARSRFAFAGLAAVTSLCATALATMAGPTPWNALFVALGHVAGINIQPEPKSWEGLLLASILVGMVVFVVLRLHRQWDGAVTVEQAESARIEPPPNLVREGAGELWRILSRRPASPIYEPGRAKPGFGELVTDVRSIPFNDLVREAFCNWLVDTVIDATEDWHSRAQCWIGRDKRTAESVVVFCTGDRLEHSMQGRFLDYLRSLDGLDMAGARLYQVRRRADDALLDILPPLNLTTLTFDELIDRLVDLDEYRERLRVAIEEQELPNSDLTLKKTYTAARVREEGAEDAVYFPDYVEEWLATDDQRHLALLGEYGEGKSTSALYLTYQLLQSRKPSDRIPVLLDLRGKSPRHSEPDEILSAWGVKYGLSGTALMILHQAGRLLLVFDGFDEMDGLGEQRTRYAHFASIWRFASVEKAKILLTGRPELFLDDTEMRRSLGVHPDVATGPYTQMLYMCRFNEQQMREALRNVSADVKEEIIALVRGSESFHDLASRPSLLQQVSTIWNTLEFRAYKENANSASILSLFLSSVFRRQAEKVRRDPRLRFMGLNEAELGFFTRATALYMARHLVQNRISGRDLHRAVDRAFQAVPERYVFTARADLGENPQSLSDRLLHVENPLEQVVTNVRSYGVLARDYDGPDLFKFSHRTYYEILCAEHAAALVRNERSAEREMLKNAYPMPLFMVLRAPVTIGLCGELLATSEAKKSSEYDQLGRIFDGVFRSGLLAFVPRWLCRGLLLDMPAKIWCAVSGAKDSDSRLVSGIQHGPHDRAMLEEKMLDIMKKQGRRAHYVVVGMAVLVTLGFSYIILNGGSNFYWIMGTVMVWTVWMAVVISVLSYGGKPQQMGLAFKRRIFYEFAKRVTSFESMERFAGAEFALAMRQEAVIVESELPRI